METGRLDRAVRVEDIGDHSSFVASWFHWTEDQADSGVGGNSPFLMLASRMSEMGHAAKAASRCK